MAIVAAIAIFLCAAALVALIVALRDVRNARASVRRIEAERDVAIQSAAERAKFLAAASHDLRQPIHAVALFTAALKRRALPEDARKVAERLSAGVESIQLQLDALIHIVRIEAGLVVARPSSIRMASVLDGLAQEYRLLAKARGLRFGYVTSHAGIATDAALFEQLIRNLLTNAIRDSAQGKVLLGCRRANRGLRVEVHSAGRVAADPSSSTFDASTAGEDGSLGHTLANRLAALLGVRAGVRAGGSCAFVEFPSASFTPVAAGDRDS